MNAEFWLGSVCVLGIFLICFVIVEAIHERRYYREARKQSIYAQGKAQAEATLEKDGVVLYEKGSQVKNGR